MEVIGILAQKLNELGGINQNNGQAWKKANYLIEIPGNYPKRMVVSVMDGMEGRIARFDTRLGKTVVVRFEIDAREYNGKWYNDLRAWGCKEYVAGNTAPQSMDATAAAFANIPPAPPINGGFGPSDTPGAATRSEQQGNIQFGDDQPPF